MLLPTTTAAANNDDANNAANLNAEFVTDNSLEQEQELEQQKQKREQQDQDQDQEEQHDYDIGENGNGNIEAETNMPDNDSASNNGDVENYDGTASAAEQQSNGETVSSLTIENNEETEAYDNFNESSPQDEDVVSAVDVDSQEPTKHFSALQSSGNVELSEYATLVKDIDADAEAVETVENVENVEKFAMNSGAMQHSNYGVINKQREDVSSSDDEADVVDAIAEQMHPQFNTEWEHLAEDLADMNDRNNDLDNDIDVYDSVPVDLSNDIAVNDVAAAAGVPTDPDAEFIDVTGSVITNSGSSNSSMPKFEKLSMTAGVNPTSYQPNAQTPTVK